MIDREFVFTAAKILNDTQRSVAATSLIQKLNSNSLTIDDIKFINEVVSTNRGN